MTEHVGKPHLEPPPEEAIGFALLSLSVILSLFFNPGKTFLSVNICNPPFLLIRETITGND
jgi:hypothetical protein